MATTIADIEAMIANQEPEGQYLDYKRGDALGTEDKKKGELVKDITGLANAGGGRIIYGVSELKVGTIGVPDAFFPVPSTTTTRDWIYSVVRSKSNPPFSDFEVEELIEPGGGRVVVIDVRPGSTAFQSTHDHCYYQRAGTHTVPMLDFQIRDVMNRRTKPVISVTLFARQVGQGDVQRYLLEIVLRNIGAVSLESWRLEVDVPTRCLQNSKNSRDEEMFHHRNFADFAVNRYHRTLGNITTLAFSDPLPSGRRVVLHPEQHTTFFLSRSDVPAFYLEVKPDDIEPLRKLQFPLSWKLFMPNNTPLSGIVPFSDWCNDDNGHLHDGSPA